MPGTETRPVESDADTGEDDGYATTPARRRSPGRPCSAASSPPCAATASTRCETRSGSPSTPGARAGGHAVGLRLAGRGGPATDSGDAKADPAVAGGLPRPGDHRPRLRGLLALLAGDLRQAARPPGWWKGSGRTTARAPGLSPSDLRSPVARIAGQDGVMIILPSSRLGGPGGHDRASLRAAGFTAVSPRFRAASVSRWPGRRTHTGPRPWPHRP